MAPAIQELFPTLLYRAELPEAAKLNIALEKAALALCELDAEGQRWCGRHGYAGYTSYGSSLDIAAAFPVFARLEKIAARHALGFARALHWELRRGKPQCDSIWVNVLPEGGAHSGHIHTNSVLSGTYYVAVPPGAGPIVFEDPRLPLLMAAPPRKASAPRALRSSVSEPPSPGTLLLWESWLRHEVPLNRAQGLRISVSFNCVIA